MLWILLFTTQMSTCFVLWSKYDNLNFIHFKINLNHLVVFLGIYSRIICLRINFEFPPTGGIVTDASFKTVRLLRYITKMDHVLMGNIEYQTTRITNKTIQISQIDFYLDSLFSCIVGCEMVLFILVIYFLVEEAIEVKSMRLEYFKSFWNCLDLCVIGVSLDVCL